MKRTLALFLTALLLISSFTSCGKKKIPEQQTEETETETIIGDGDNSNITDNGGNGGSGDNGDNGGSGGNGGNGDNGGSGGNGGSGDNGGNDDNGTTDGGNGNQSNDELPKPIESVEDLKEMTLNGNYYLESDVDLNGAEWTPIGDSENPFTGTFNGNGHTISNFTINSNTQHAGLFGYNKGIVENVKLKSVTINIANNEVDIYVGALIGKNEGTVKRCYAEGIVNGTVSAPNEANSAIIGGLIGFSSTGDVTECGASCTVTATSTSKISCAGGLIGFVDFGNVTNSYACGDVFAYYNTLTQTDEYSSAAGGLVAHNSKGIIANCFASGNTTAVSQYVGPSFSGGLVASNMNSGTIANCYALGNVTSQTANGYISSGDALCGYITSGFTSTVQNSYCSSSQTISASNNYSYVEEKSLTEIKTADFHTTTLGWSSDIWSFNDGSNPTLKALA